MRTYDESYYREQFKGLDRYELLDRLANPELAEAARKAATTLLATHGVTGSALPELVTQHCQAELLTTSATRECDGCRAPVNGYPLILEGQKFCGIDCFHTSRVRAVAAGIPDSDALDHAEEALEAACPKCEVGRDRLGLYKFHYAGSFLVFYSEESQMAFCCRTCARKASLWALLYCVLLGWWSPAGLFRTPVMIIANIHALLERRSESGPSPELIEWSRAQIAEARLQAEGGGRWSVI